MRLQYPDRSDFTTGVSEYTCRPATAGERINRLFIPIRIEDVDTDAVVDTGGAYLIIHPEIADELDLDPAAALPLDQMNIRGNLVKGHMHRVHVTFPATEGDSLEVEVTAFVPEDAETWGLPSFVGWHLCLERLRFAIDPSTERFFFGASD